MRQSGARSPGTPLLTCPTVPLVPTGKWACCRACSCALHFQGGRTWNHGAHADYQTLPDEAIQLCPDCHWLWIKASSNIPRRPAASTPADINAHMETQATSCVPAAGLYSPAAASMVVPSRPGGANHLEGSGGGYRRDMVLGSLRNCNPRTNAIRVFGCPDGPHEQHFIS